MNKVIKVDEYNMQVTCQCGVPLQELDDMLRERGLTTGHSPQSKPLAQMGDWLLQEVSDSSLPCMAELKI
ncbi:MAG: FAD-binding protein [[Clostridium] scindens]